MSGGPLFLDYVVKRVIDHVTDEHSEIKRLKSVIENHRAVLRTVMKNDEHSRIQVGSCDLCSNFYTYSLFEDIDDDDTHVCYCKCDNAVCEDCNIMCNMCHENFCDDCPINFCDICEEFFCENCKCSLNCERHSEIL